MVFSPTSSFNKAKLHLAEQANKAMHLLYKRINNLKLPIDLQLKLFDQTIVPILTFASETWGMDTNFDCLEKVHLSFLRKITNSRKSTPAYMLYGELNRYPLSIRIFTRMIGYWNKLILQSPDKYSTFVYKAMLNSNNNYKWLQTVKNVFDTTGYTYIFNNQFNNSSKTISKLIERSLMDQFIQKWHNSMTVSNKGRNYNTIKTSFAFEKYLTAIPLPNALTLFKIRTANHKLPVESGIWNHIPYNERYCTQCTNRDLGDLYHYLFICDNFKEQRTKYLKRFYFTHPNMIKILRIN